LQESQERGEDDGRQVARGSAQEGEELMSTANIPFISILASFLKAAAEHNMETAVWAQTRGVVGGAQHNFLSGNTGEAIQKARTAFIVEDGMIEHVAEAVHAFRFVEEGKDLEPGVDLCMFGPCPAMFDPDSPNEQLAKIPWERLPDIVRDAHRAFAKVLLGVVSTGVPKEEKSKIVV
jgi:hypothetical protein